MTLRRTPFSATLAVAVVLVSGLARAASGQVVFDATPRTYQVVRVPVPAAVAGGVVSYSVAPEANVQLLSAAAGTIDATVSETAVLLTLRVSSGTQPGSPLAARVSFTGRGAHVETPVHVNVPFQHAIVLAADREIPSIRAGERGLVKFRVTNAGNIRDTVRVSLKAQGGWRVSPREISIVLAPGATEKGEFRIFIGSGTGDAYFTLLAAARDTSISETVFARVVQVADGLVAGPTMRVSMGAAGPATGAARAATNVSLNGPLYGGVRIHADFASLQAADALQSRALSAVGIRAAQPHLGFSGDAWRMDLGNTWTDFPDVMGTGITGQGVSYRYTGKGSSVQLLAARPSYRVDGEDAAMLGIGGERAFDAFSVSASAVRFDDPATGRELTAVGAGIRTSAWDVAEIDAGAAYRDHGDGRGVGFSTGLRREDDRGFGEVRVAFAPGGTRGYAAAQQQASVSGMRQISERLAFSGGYTRSADKPTPDGTSVSTTASLSPQLRISPALNVVATLQQASASFTDAATGFGNATRAATLGISGGEKLTWSANGGFERVGRSVTLAEGTFNSISDRLKSGGAASYATDAATLRVDANYDWNLGAAGGMPNVFRATLGADRVRIGSLPAGLTFSGELGLMEWGGRAYLRSRAGTTYQLARGYEIVAAVDRDPFYGVDGAVPIAFSASVTRTLSLPGFGSLTTGHVFADLNGNGKRDEGEDGIADVPVRAGQQTARTGANGKYRIAAASRNEIRIDAVDIPFGWTAGPKASLHPRDIPLVPVSALEVGLDLGAAERARGVDISRMIVIARDEHGREWLARRTTPEIARFDGLPPGSYTVAFDNSAMLEPLRAAEGDVTVQINRATTEKRTVRLVGRPLRFFSAPVAADPSPGGTQ